MDKNDIINYVMHTPHNTNKAVLSDMLNQLTEGGGGGSSDFSTAEVTLNISGEFGEFSRESCPFVDTDNNLIKGVLWTDTSPTIFIVPLYKGKCYWDSSFFGATITGGIESYEDGLLITGDGTISITIS